MGCTTKNSCPTLPDSWTTQTFARLRSQDPWFPPHCASIVFPESWVLSKIPVASHFKNQVVYAQRRGSGIFCTNKIRGWGRIYMQCHIKEALIYHAIPSGKCFWMHRTTSAKIYSSTIFVGTSPTVDFSSHLPALLQEQPPPTTEK